MKYGFTLPVIAIGLAFLTLIGWAGEVVFLKALGRSGASMNPASAVGLILLSLESIRLSLRDRRPLLSWCGLMAVLVVMAVGLSKLSDIFLNTHFDIDAILFAEQLQTDPLHSAKIAPNTAAAFVLLAASLLLLRVRRPEIGLFAAQSTVIVPAAVTFLALISVLYDVNTIYGSLLFTPMPVNTALSIFALCAAVLMTYPHRGFMRYLINTGPAGFMSSILLPAVIVVPVVLGWLSLVGVRAWLYNAEFGIALSVVLNVLMFVAVVCLCARLMFLLDVKRRSAETELHFHATHDPLTGLSNRRAFLGRLERVTARDGKIASCAVLFLDLDGFKAVNDRLGHEAGDKLLKAVANTILQCTRVGDTVARLGGDEFTILVERIKSETDLVALAERILSKIPEAFSFLPPETPLGVSIGIAFHASGLKTASDILGIADSALYKAKAEGKGCYRIVRC